MEKSYGRRTRKKVGDILTMDIEYAAMKKLEQIPDKQLVNHLFSHFYHKDELIKFRSIKAMGLLGARVGHRNMEQARVILRRIMWNLNDESGGIGWGSPEAMGEILRCSPKLAMEFHSILFSYLQPGGNFIEHEMLQRGVIWGVGTCLKGNRDLLDQITEKLLLQHLQSVDHVKKAYAMRALINADFFKHNRVAQHLISDRQKINMFTGWNFLQTTLEEMACKI